MLNVPARLEWAGTAISSRLPASYIAWQTKQEIVNNYNFTDVSSSGPITADSAITL
jgi:hypothetical protein